MGEPVEFEKEPVEVHQDLKKITSPFGGIHGIYLKLIKES